MIILNFSFFNRAKGAEVCYREMCNPMDAFKRRTCDEKMMSTSVVTLAAVVLVLCSSVIQQLLPTVG